MKVSTTIECEEDVNTVTTLAEQNPEIQKSLATICDVVGDEVTVEKAKLLLKGAGYNVEVAINHLLDDLEKHGRTSPTPKAGFDDKVNKILSDLAEEVKCAVCLGYFNDPVVLNCLHTFCSSCLASAVHKRKLICPLCRVETKLDSSGVGGLKRNYYLANIVEKLKTAQTNRICSECQSSICSVFCKQCKVFLCNACNERVHSIRLLHSHIRIPFEQCFAISSNVKTSKSKRIANMIVDDTDFVIPFNVKVDVCYDLFHQWARSLWFVPTDFSSKSVIEQFTAMYLPYYLFDVDVATQYSGTCAWSALNHLSKTYSGTGGQSSKTVKKVSKTLSDVLVCGSAEVIDDELLKAIGPWKVDQIQRFTLKHSDGVEVKGFKDTVENAWKDAKVEVSERMKLECENQAKKANPLEKLLQLNVHTKVLKRRVKRIFVPVYVAEVEYRGKTYIFAVNGATTKVSGQRPYSTTKLASLSVTGLSAAIGLISIVRK